MIIILTFEAKSLPTDTFHSSHCIVVAFDAIITICTRTALIRFASIREKLTNLFQVFIVYF